MKTFLYLSLASAILMAAADKPGGGSSAADDARAKAQEARDKQAAEEKAKAEKEAQAGKDASDGGGGASDGEKSDGRVPVADAGGLDPSALLARLDAQDRLIQTLTAQMAGQKGPGLTEAKDTQAASPGAAVDPRLVRPLPAGVSSSPAFQPMPAGDGGRSGVVGLGGPDQSRAYPDLKDEDVVVVATGYHDDAIRNAGDVILGYTGPAGSWFVPSALVKEIGNLEDAAREWRKKLIDFARNIAA